MVRMMGWDGMGGVGGVYEMCMCLARAVWEVRG